MTKLMVDFSLISKLNVVLCTGIFHINFNKFQLLGDFSMRKDDLRVSLLFLHTKIDMKLTIST